MPKIILLIADSMRSGKSTVADYLVSQYGYAKFSIASTIKKATITLLQECGLSRQEAEQRCFGNKKEEPVPILSTPDHQVTTRRILQLMGTEVRNLIFDDEVWLRILERQAQGKDLVVVDDIRYEHEINFFKKRYQDVSVIRVVRPGATVSLAQQHASEGGLVDYREDFRLDNDGTIKQLQEKIDEVLTGND